MRQRLLHIGLQFSTELLFSASNSIRLRTITPPVLGTTSSYLNFLFSPFVDCYVSFHTYPFLSIPIPNPNSKIQLPISSHHRRVRLQLYQFLLQKSKYGFDKLEDALELLEQMLQMRRLPSVIHFNRILIALDKMKHYSTVIMLFTKIYACTLPINLYTMNTVINCYCHLNRVDYGFCMLAGIIKRGFVPNVVTYTILIRGLLREDKFTEAVQLFEKLIGIDPDAVMFATIINGLCKTGNTSMAIRLLQVMEQVCCGNYIAAYDMVIDGLCKDKLVDDALDLFFIMIEKGIPPDVVTYNSLIQGLCDLNRWEEAKLLLIEMNSIDISPDIYTFNILLNACCKERKVKDAELLVEVMVQEGKNPKDITCNTLMDGRRLQSKKDGPLAVLNTMINMSSKGIVPDSISYTTLISSYCRELKLNKAMQLFWQMPLVGLQPLTGTYNTILWGLLQMGKHIEALNFFYEMQAQGSMPNIVTFCTLVDGLCKNQHVDEALVLLHMMENNGFLPSNWFYSILIYRLCKNKRLDKAISLFDKVLSKGLRPGIKAYNIMIQGLYQEGLLKEANELLVEMESNDCLPNEVCWEKFARYPKVNVK